MSSEVLKTVSKILGDLPAASVLRERVLFLKDQIDLLNKRIVNLEKENADLKKELAETNIKSPDSSNADEFVEHDGALFKRKPSNSNGSSISATSGYHRAVYCPECHRSTSIIDEDLGYFCLKCKWDSGIREHQLNGILKSLP